MVTASVKGGESLQRDGWPTQENVNKKIEQTADSGQQ
jgi:hypothetical protein